MVPGIAPQRQQKTVSAPARILSRRSSVSASLPMTLTPAQPPGTASPSVRGSERTHTKKTAKTAARCEGQVRPARYLWGLICPESTASATAMKPITRCPGAAQTDTPLLAAAAGSVRPGALLGPPTRTAPGAPADDRSAGAGRRMCRGMRPTWARHSSPRWRTRPTIRWICWLGCRPDGPNQLLHGQADEPRA